MSEIQEEAPGTEQGEPEQQQEQAKPDVVPVSAVEDAARQQGWSPDKGELSALEFLARGREFRDRQFDEIKSLRTDNAKAMDAIATFITKQEKKEREQETQSIEAQIREATEQGDVDKVLSLTKKISRPEAPVATDTQQAQYMDSWKSENKWFNEDADMRTDAVGFYQAEVLRSGTDLPTEILPKVLDRIKRIYPKKFNIENPNAARSAGAEKGGRQVSKKGVGLDKGDLSEIERAHFDDFVKMGMKEENLLRSIARQREIANGR